MNQRCDNYIKVDLPDLLSLFQPHLSQSEGNFAADRTKDQITAELCRIRVPIKLHDLEHLLYCGKMASEKTEFIYPLVKPFKKNFKQMLSAILDGTRYEFHPFYCQLRLKE
jgi:hypothetical protein